MSDRKYGPQLFALIYTLALCLIAGANLAKAQSPDDTSLVNTATRNFLEAYQRKDVDGLLSLWSAKSPDLPAFTAAVKQTFLDVASIELKGVEIRRVTFEGAESIVRVTVEMQATELKSGKPATGFGRMNRTLRFVKEDGRWKLWQYKTSEERLALNLLSAKTESDQMALLEEERELQTAALLQALRKHFESFTKRKEPSQALIALRLTQLVAEKIADEAAVAFAVNNMGVIYFQRGEFPRALELFQKHLSLGVTARDQAMTARTLHNIGTIKRLQGDYPQALEYLLRSLTVAEQVGDKRILGGVLNSVGVVHREQGNYARALAYLERGLTMSEAVGDKGTMSLTLNNIGTIHGSQGNHAQAVEYFQRTLKLGQASGDKAMIANALNNIGITHYSQREFLKALDYYRQSLALREELNDKRMAALTMNNIGIIHRELGDLTRALEYYRESLALREKLEDQAGTAAALNHIGIIHFLQGDFREALQISSRVLEIATRLASPELIWRGHELAGRAHTGLKEFDAAEKAFKDSIDTIEKMRHRVGGGELARQRFFEDKLAPYVAMVDLSFIRSQPIDALTYAELAKARTLLDVLRNGKVHINKALSSEEQEMERASNAELTALNTQIYEESQRLKPNRDRIAELEPRREKARMAHEAFLTSLYVKHPELKVQRGETTPITAAEAASLLPDAGTAFLEFVVAQEKSYLIVLTRDRKRNTAPLEIMLYPLNINSKQLTERVGDFRRMLADRDFSYQESARQLYDLLLKPAEQQLRGRKTLCVVPDQALWELPFQALQPRPGVHMIEDFTLFYAPSLSVMREVMKNRVSSRPSGSQLGVVKVSNRRPYPPSSRPAKTLLALGNPQLKGEMVASSDAFEIEGRVGPLPEAEKEVKVLAGLYGAANSRVFIGSDAREARVKSEAPKYEILHFATHGLLDDRNPMFSYLTLAQSSGDPNEDGLLEAREIINMDLRAELAVLSACEMARGWVGAGEGVIGMTWSLFVAGVPTTVASQWKVDSASTTSLMIDFHRRLTTQRSNVRSKEKKAESLRQAALGLSRSERYRHPFYWAGFVMVGDGW
jgi:CHAT domain-containing protein/Tfp pilus assembly protein PilF